MQIGKFLLKNSKTQAGDSVEPPGKIAEGRERMGEKDILEKNLMSYADVFADCENALAYGGHKRLKAEEPIWWKTEKSDCSTS